MARLFRPHIPLSVRVQVAERQLRALVPPGKFRYTFSGTSTLGNKLKALLPMLAEAFGCEITDLRLDHDPALGARQRLQYSAVIKPTYIPAANDPNHLNYRPHGPQFENSHLIKTNVRGEHGQHPDRVLIKKQRRLERGPKPKRGPKIQSAGFKRGQKAQWPKRSFGRKP